MKFTWHLNAKNSCAVVAGACVIVLAYIPLAIPPEHWSRPEWKVAVLVAGIVAVIALIYQATLQSKEDAEYESREQGRDVALAELQKSLMPKSGPSVSNASNAITRSVPHSPGAFDSVAFFRTAYLSPLQDVGANSYIAEAERVRPENKESFYLDVLATGSIQMLYDNLWWISYRSQIRALAALNAASGMLPLQEFRKPFDEASVEFASEYARIQLTFQEWLQFLVQSLLVNVHPSNMVEITLKGKDFLKYLLHHGRNADVAKRL